MSQTPKMLVSVLSITYNHERYIAQALDSFLNQETDFDFEIVIGDDCSKDKTRDILLQYQAKYPDKIRLLLHEKNIGAMQNCIQVFNACRGKYIAVCEGDDYWIDPLKLQKQADFLENNPSYSGASGGVNVFYENTNEYKYPVTLKNPLVEHDITMASYLGLEHTVYLQTLMFRKDLVKTADMVYSYADLFIQTEILQYGPIKHLPYLVTVYRIHSAGATNSILRKEKKRLFGDLINIFTNVNKKTNYKYDKVMDLRLFQYKVCYKFSDDNISLLKRIWLTVSFFFSKIFLKSPSVRKAKIILHTLLKGSYKWNNM